MTHRCKETPVRVGPVFKSPSCLGIVEMFSLRGRARFTIPQEYSALHGRRAAEESFGTLRLF